MAINLGADDNGGFGNAFQRQFKRSIGVGGEPSMMEPKKTSGDATGPGNNTPRPKDWNGWQEQPDQMEGGPFGGAGGPMPVPDGGPNWRGVGGVGAGDLWKDNPNWGKPSEPNPYQLDAFMDPNYKGPGPFTGYDQNYWDRKRGNTTGGFDPVGGGGLGGPQPVDVPNGSGAGGPMPMPWGGGNTMTATGDDGWIYGPDGNRYRRSDSNGTGAGGPMPQKWPQGASPVPGNPNAFYMQNHPSNPNSKYAQWKASQQQAPAQPPPGNTGIVPPHRQDGRGNGGPQILGGPFGPPRPQGGPQIPQFQGGQAFNFSDMMQGQPQNGWNWGDLGNIRNRRF